MKILFSSRILDTEIDVGLEFETERHRDGTLLIKVLHIPPEIDIENMIKNICDLGAAAEEQFRRNQELIRRMLGRVPIFGRIKYRFVSVF